MIEPEHADKVMGYLQQGRDEGARLLFGGERVRQDSGGDFITPAIFDEVTNDMRIAREEIFGPVLVVIAVDDLDEALTVANDTDYGLGAAIWTNRLSDGHRAARAACRHRLGQLLRPHLHQRPLRWLQAVRSGPRQVVACLRQVHRTQDHLDRAGCLTCR